jgi:NADPH-dependent ferric siderophore reductase
VTEWTKTVQPGQEIALHGPSGSKQPDTKHLLLFGDETAMPVILRMIEDAPEDTQGAAVVAVRDPTDAQLVETQSGIKVRWIDMADTNDLFEELTDFTRDYPNAFVFFAAERNQATRVREHLKGTGLSPKLYKAASYWTKP